MKEKKIDKTPARLDFIQSASGLILAIFIMGHLLFEASILISNEAMYKMTIFFEGYYFFGETYPGIISFLAAAISIILVLHILAALRKFPSDYRKYKLMKNHMDSMQHEDTSIWMIQVVTGFMMFFTAMTNQDDDKYLKKARATIRSYSDSIDYFIKAFLSIRIAKEEFKKLQVS